MKPSPFLDREIVDENALAFAIRDGYPISTGHTLVCSKRVVAYWTDLTREERVAVMDLVDGVIASFNAMDGAEDCRPDGFNVGINVGTAAGQTVAHVIPRFARMVGNCAAQGITPSFPIIETGTTKQQCADWSTCEMGVRPSAMYEWSDHANCVGCVKGGRAYWLAVAEHHPDVFAQRVALEREFGHSIIRGDNPIFLDELVQVGLKRRVSRREPIEIGACECGD